MKRHRNLAACAFPSPVPRSESLFEAFSSCESSHTSPQAASPAAAAADQLSIQPGRGFGSLRVAEGPPKHDPKGVFLHV